MLPHIALSKDFGKVGNTFPIVEEGFISMIYRNLSKIDIDKLQAEIVNISKKKFKAPKNIDHIKRAVENRNFVFDPTYILDRDIILPNGSVIYRKNHKINPLDYTLFDRILYFIDARDDEQVEWLKAEISDASIDKTRHIILTGGSPSEMEQILGQEIYFDQFGELTSKFGIDAVPAVVEQGDGSRYLSIDEILI